MKQGLCNALAKCIGQELTVELAKQIVAEAMTPPDVSHDPASFEHEQHGDCTFQVESFRAILPELIPLHEAHWFETEKHRHGLPLNPDYDQMGERERAGRMLQFTIRRDGELIGHSRMYLATSMHSQTLFAEEDTLYVKPEHRGGLMVVALMRYGERLLRALGVREIRANSKLVNRADVLMRRMKYQPVALQFVKLF